MKYPLIAALLFASFTAQAAPTYLKCDLLSPPNYQQFSSTEQRTAFIRSMLLSGNAGYIDPPSETWVVDLENGQIRSPEDSDSPETSEWFTVRDLKVTEGRILGKTKFGSVFDLNRISLKLSYTKLLGEESFKVQGITVPTTSTWTYQCSASKAPSV